MATALMLRSSSSDRSSYGGFIYPESGIIEAPDWNPTPECGGGLHGFLWGEGDGSLANWNEDAVWQVLSFELEAIVSIGGGDKIKIPKGEIVFSGDRKGATDYILEHGGYGRAVIGAFVTAGDKGHALVGYGGTATAGKYGTATAGYGGTATAGYGGTATAGKHGTATAGKYGTIMIKWWDEKNSRYRIATGYIGENELEPNVSYKCNEKGEFVKA